MSTSLRAWLVGLAVAMVTMLANAVELVEVATLPDHSVQPEALAESLPLSTTVQWTLGPRLPKDKTATAPMDHKGITIMLEKDHPIEIVVETDYGVPVIMLSDGPIHPLDGRAFAGNYDPENPFPGNPIAYAIGTGQKARVAVTPQVNGAAQIWVWVLPGQLKAQEPVELPPEMSSAYIEQGYSEESIRLLMEVPDIVRAWEASDVEKSNP